MSDSFFSRPTPGKTRWLVLTSLILTSVAVVAVGLQVFYAWPLVKTHPISKGKIQSREGRGVAKIKMMVTEGQEGKLIENGRSIGKSVGRLETISLEGGGLFKAKDDALYFSSSDGSDPRTNVYQYAFQTPIQPSESALWMTLVLWLIAGSAWIVFCHEDYQKMNEALRMFLSDREELS